MTSQRWLAGILAGMCLMAVNAAYALVDITDETVDQAIAYGIDNGGSGLSYLLGNNWIEGPNGMLINIYSPFMMIAAKAAKGGYASPANKEDVKSAKKRYYRTIRDFVDPKKKDQVKFSVALYGNSPEFGGQYTAWIEGIGRGKEFRLKPVRQVRDKIADPVTYGTGRGYEAINAYYFNISDLLMMDTFKFYVQQGTEEPTVFNIVNANIK
jgi:hypothetical protein